MDTLNQIKAVDSKISELTQEIIAEYDSSMYVKMHELLDIRLSLVKQLCGEIS